ncbi:pyridoxal-phosphate-dependent aminotransferase family protein [Candidatus Galacturonibacter soehngenii]|uniref:Alanine--glyoxylate aminotransferase family protein n=1 Tax=Candidatus Galacturonatibacter soehngenii TaxID=2307010 RepID=A0A7V7UDP5_9FIRM|nr:alanine--glyoxylate aminotransferase family protein [Candidatus Galacturonibacter soehngenii]KAB1440941.1 alanine--glyoxylate aminotransferase family protein [Candidatus Galacturonibacter soehngenii]MBA4688716.1 alanine--glyoxylate aminotransferase family protein [Candidatus Galacturonibacter soehngenii]
MIKLMTPGPTQVRENVRLSRSMETTNPDLDVDFYNDYHALCKQIGDMLHTKNLVYIMSGEGILGLEASCASITEPGDKVLVLDNGIFGKGFGDFVSIYGGIPVYYSDSYEHEINVERLASFLESHHDFKYATLVHCDTPSGVLNEIDKICPLLHNYGIMTVVDAVSSMFGEPIDVDKSKIDILCGASQKVISAPPGLTFLTVSKSTLHCMENRTTPIASFYANILNFKDYYKKKWFPYTMPISDIYGLQTAIENIKKDKKIYQRHKKIASCVRNAVISSGLELYIKSGYSSTVTVIKVPDVLNCCDILTILKEKYHILIAGGFDILENKVIRIGHMGENCNIDDVAETLDALSRTFELLHYPLEKNLKTSFITSLESYEESYVDTL